MTAQYGHLVNNLDLQVIDPKGNQYWGNTGLNRSTQADTVNNVEQVQILMPKSVSTWCGSGERISSRVAINNGEIRRKTMR